MKRFLLLAACSILAACGNLGLTEANTALNNTTNISSVKYIEENQIQDNEVDFSSYLDEALAYQAAATAHYMELVHADKVAEWKADQAKVSHVSAASVGEAVAPSGDFYYRLFGCETGYTYNTRIVSKSGKYRGGFQFTMSTWASAGGTGDPIDASYEEQRLRAQINITPGNFSHQHPACSREMYAEGWEVPVD